MAIVKKIDYPKNISNHQKIRCSKTSEQKYKFSNSTSILNGSRCSRSAIYSIDGVLLCKAHAGELLLMKGLDNDG